MSIDKEAYKLWNELEPDTAILTDIMRETAKVFNDFVWDPEGNRFIYIFFNHGMSLSNRVCVRNFNYSIAEYSYISLDPDIIDIRNIKTDKITQTLKEDFRFLQSILMKLKTEDKIKSYILFSSENNSISPIYFEFVTALDTTFYLTLSPVETEETDEED